MAAILPFVKNNGVFDPMDVKVMSMAFDDVCKCLNVKDGRKREAMAERIIELAGKASEVRRSFVIRCSKKRAKGTGAT